MTFDSQGIVVSVSSLLARKLSRRGFLMRTAIVGSAVATSGLDYVLRPVPAYASVCGTDAACADGYTAMCCTINHGVNQCPPGSFAGGWWKADGASLCGGQARYYIDCQAECTHCGCHGGAFCAEGCWSCRPHCADGECDKRRVCHNVFRYGQCERDRPCSGPVTCRAISCTPPWEWLACSTASATDQSTVSHSATCLSGWGPILAKYTAMGSQGSILGASVGREHRIKGGAVRQDYQHGRIYYRHDVGAHWLSGPVLAKYENLHDARARLGLPTTDLRSHDSYEIAEFQHGTIARAHDHHAGALWGAVEKKWRALDGPNGVLGLPTGDVEQQPHRAVTASFTEGDIAQLSGAHPTAIWGPVDRKWRSLGRGSSVVGYPTLDLQPGPNGGSYSVCQTGDIADSPSTGAHAVWGPVDTAWRDYDGVGGALGYPLTDVVTAASGVQQGTFQHGTVTYDPATGQTTVVMD